MVAQEVPPSPPLLEENLRLRRAVEELSVLNDLGRAIGASLNSQEIMQTIIHRSLRALHAEQGVITLVDQEPDQPLKTLVRSMVSSAAHAHYHFNQSLLGWMHLNKKPITINDPSHDERFRGVRWDDALQSLLCVPLMIKSELKGVLTVYNKKGGGAFTDDDQRLLAIIAAQSAQVVENARLYESEQAFQQMKEEVRLAAKIQNDLLPQEPPSIPGYDIAGKSVPAHLVGGDYYDFIPLEHGSWAIGLGDVSGKGLPASLLMANLQATLRGQAILAEQAKLCIRRANRLLHQSTSAEKFVTLFYGALDPVHHTLTYCNAGHDNPILCRCTGGRQRLSTGGIVLSILDDFPYEEETVSLDPGDLLVIYTDGITEAINSREEQFGEMRLAEVIDAHRNAPAAEVIDQIISSVRRYAAGAPQMDDMTLVAVRRLAG
jgi:sigma-B regulation protein RsbU (phosphoserine phosphatase)